MKRVFRYGVFTSTGGKLKEQTVADSKPEPTGRISATQGIKLRNTPVGAGDDDNWPRTIRRHRTRCRGLLHSEQVVDPVKEGGSSPIVPQYLNFNLVHKYMSPERQLFSTVRFTCMYFLVGESRPSRETMRFETIGPWLCGCPQYTPELAITRSCLRSAMASAETQWMPTGRHRVSVGSSLARALKARKGAAPSKRSNLPDRDFYSFRCTLRRLSPRLV